VRKRFDIRERIGVLLFGAVFVVGTAAAFVALLRDGSPSAEAATILEESADIETSSEPIRPIPLHVKQDEEKVALGRRLFHETRLSGNDTISCAHCHDLATGGTDRKACSLGIHGEAGARNSSTVFNCSLNVKQFWDGRADSLEDQIDGPIHDPKEMDANWPAIVGKLRSDPGYAASFARVYPGGVESVHVKNAIAEFERSLLTPNARFDRFLRGDAEAITSDEKEGYRLFKGYGCVSCHQGVGVGGNMFATFGVMADYFADRGELAPLDLGRFNVTGKEADRYRFKVPMLRNVALTAPYFHDGSAPTLAAAVNVMARFQLGRQISEVETSRIVQFLETLTGEYQGEILR
jgi:cytochrome c peroxidase